MNFSPTIFLLIATALAPFYINCAATSDGADQTVAQSYYYDPASPDHNQGYFATVKSHFSEIGTAMSDDDLHDYTATRHITSIPPGAEVYVGTQYMGRTNHGDLYFKTGQYVVNFRINGDEWTEILSFVDGNNAELLVRKP